MKIMVTGSAGFIGSHLTRRLKDDGHLVYEIDRKTGVEIGSPVFNQMFEDNKVDFIFHLAGDCSTLNSLKNPHISLRDNLFSTVIAFQVARKNNCPIIFTSTCKTKRGEDGSRTPYGASKLMAEIWADECLKTYDTEMIINKPGTIYGPGQEASEESGWLGWFIKASIENKPVEITGYGEQSRDLLYIDDYIDLLMDQFHNFPKYKNQTFDVGGGENNEVTINWMADYLKLEYMHVDDRPGDVMRFVSDNEISEINGWKPTTHYRQGIKKTKEYYEDLSNRS